MFRGDASSLPSVPQARAPSLEATRRDGVRIYYRAADGEVSRFVGSLGELARARLAEVDQILQEIGAGQRSTERVTRLELLRRVRAGDVIVIDVRPHEEYDAGHIPGARSVPLEHLELHLSELDPAVEVVAYCRGPLCLLAPQAVATLRGHGREAHCLEDGMPEWRQAGLPVAAGADSSPTTSRREPNPPMRRTARPAPSRSSSFKVQEPEMT